MADLPPIGAELPSALPPIGSELPASLPPIGSVLGAGKPTQEQIDAYIKAHKDRADFTNQLIQQGLHAGDIKNLLATQQPLIGQGENQGSLATIPASTDKGVAGGILDTINSMGSGFTTPFNLAMMLPSGPLEPLKLTYFGAQGLKGTAEGLGGAVATALDPNATPYERAASQTAPVLSGLMTAAMAKSGSQPITTKLTTASTKQALAEANQAANGIATYTPGQPEDLSGMQPSVPDANADIPSKTMDFGDLSGLNVGIPKGVNDKSISGMVMPEDLGLAAQKTRSASPIQLQIERDLGIGEPKGITETQLEFKQRAREEAIKRTEIETATQAAHDAFTQGLGLPEKAPEHPSVDPAKHTVLARNLAESAILDSKTKGPDLDALRGQQVVAEGVNDGKPGQLVQADDGTWQLLTSPQKAGEPTRLNDIPNAKGDNILAKDVKVVPAGTQNRFAFLASQGLGAGDPFIFSAIGKLAAKITGQDQETEDEWAKRGFILGVGAMGLSRFGTRAGLQKLGAAAFHGTPHEVVKEVDGQKIPAFDITKIGSGEGSQAYGHGLYFAENPKVGEAYQRGTAQRTEDFSALSPKENSSIPYALLKEVKQAQASGQPDARIRQNLEYWLEDLRDPKQQYLGDDTSVAAVEKLLKSGDFSTKGIGNLYQVDLKAKDDELLHWDKSLKEQPHIKKALSLVEDGYDALNENGDSIRHFEDYDAAKAFSEDYRTLHGKKPDIVSTSLFDRIPLSSYDMGKNLYHKLGNLEGERDNPLQNKSGSYFNPSEKLASEALDRAGIKGIKYADQGSRGISSKPYYEDGQWKVDDGSSILGSFDSKAKADQFLKDRLTHNYVIFNDKNVEITHKNGEPVVPRPSPKGISQAGEGGAISKSLMQSLAIHGSTTTAGALIGYQTGNTPEEKRRNAILGALVGLGGSSSVHAALILAKKNPGLVDQIKAIGVDSSKSDPFSKNYQPTSTRPLDAVQVNRPAEISVDSQHVGSPEVRSSNPEVVLSESAAPRKPISINRFEKKDSYKARIIDGMKEINDRVKSSPSVDIEAKKQIADMAAQADRPYEPASYLAAIHNRMLELEAGGRAAVKERNAAVTEDIANKTEEIKNDALPKDYRKLQDLEKTNQTGQRLSLVGRLGAALHDAKITLENGYNAIDQHTANRDTNLNTMDGVKGFRGALSRIIGGTLDLAYTKEQNLKSDWKDPIRQAVALKLQPGLIKKGLEAAGFGQLDSKSLERVNIYAHRRMDLSNPDIPNTHLADSGITPELADSIKLTEPEQAYYDAARKVLDEQSGPTVRQAMHDGFNVDVGQVKDYWPTQVIGRRSLKTAALGKTIPGEAGHEAAIDDLIKGLTADFTGRPTTKTNEGQTIEKQEGAGGKINLSADLIDRHLNQAAHLVSHAKELQSLGKIVRQDFFREKYGDKGQKYVLDLLDSVARDSDPAGSRKIPVVDAITKNYAVAILALRAFSQLKHVSNVAIAANEVGPARFVSGMVDANTTAGKALLKKAFPESYQRSGGETTIQELLEGNRWQKAQAASFFIERVADRQIAGGSTLAAYKNELERMGKDTTNYLTDPINSDAQKHALIVARKVVTSSLRKDSPQAISRGALTGGSMTLSRAAFQFLQTALRQIHYAKTEVLDEGVRKGDLAHASAAVAALVAGLAIETAMVEASKKTFGAKEKPSDALSFPGEMAKEAVRKVPFAGNVLAAAGHGDTGIPSVDLTVHGIHSLGQLYTGKNEFGTPLRGRNLAATQNDALTFAGSVAGVPGAAAIGQAYKNKVIKK